MSRVLIFGTFDRLHEGHFSFFRQAGKLGSFLIAVVARDKFVKKAKGRLPASNEILRARNLRKINMVGKVILGSRTHDFYTTIRTYKPKIVALGYDQSPSIWKLKRNLKRHRIKNVKIVRLRPYKPRVYKSSKLDGEI